MDGVIFDTEQLGLRCWKIVGDRHGLENMEETVRKCIGTSSKDTKRIMNEAYGKLSDLEADERFRRFLRVTPSHLVNCDHITSLTDDAMIVNGVKLPVSRRRRKECLEKMAALLGGGRG